MVHRSDGSGTTYIFTNYLTKVSTQWSSDVGNSKSVEWPGDIGGQGNEGVAGAVSKTTGAIGYVELAYAIQNNLTVAALRNKSGNYVLPSIDATSLAANGVTLPDDMKIMVTDSANGPAYPIAGFTWILVFKNQKDCAAGKSLVDLLWWGIHDGQAYSKDLDYAPLPPDAVTKAEAELKSITCDGQVLHP